MRNRDEWGSSNQQAPYFSIGFLWWFSHSIILFALLLNVGCSPTNEILPTNTQSSPPPPTPIIQTPTHFSTSSPPTPTNALNAVMTVSGYVVDGGDTTPPGLNDVPRVFEYRIERVDGSIVLVTYTAYPPSPSGNERNKIRLNFHAGEIQIRDYLQAHGNYDTQTNTLTIAEEGHFIETYPLKP